MCHSDDCEGGRISKETGIFQEIPRYCSEWHDCHSDDRREEESLANTIFILNGMQRSEESQKKRAFFRRFLAIARNDIMFLSAKNVVILNGMQWSEESPKKWVYCEISHIRSRWQQCHSECSVSGMKNLKQIAEDSSYSFGMTSGQKGERFLAIARNNNGLPPSLGRTVC